MATAAEDYLAKLSDWGSGVPDSHQFNAHWELVDRFVADVGAERALAAARHWCDSVEPATRGAGLDVLGTLARSDIGLVADLIERARSALDSDDDDVRWSAAVALQQIDDASVHELRVVFLRDRDRDVRYQAVHGLVVVDPDMAEEHPVVQGLLRAMEDPDADVRDWATFVVGSQLNLDTPSVRDALARSLAEQRDERLVEHPTGDLSTDLGSDLDSEGDDDTAGEAAVGLARRHDPRVYPVLAVRLADPYVGNLYVEAAYELADPRLLPLLQSLKAAGWQDDDPRPYILDDAISACSTLGAPS